MLHISFLAAFNSDSVSIQIGQVHGESSFDAGVEFELYKGCSHSQLISIVKLDSLLCAYPSLVLEALLFEVVPERELMLALN